MFYYAVDNLLAGDDVVLSSSSEDALYVLENLHNGRPSKPFRFAGVGAPADPEWVCAEFDAPKRATLAAVFNHNLSLASSNDALVLKACDGGCESAASAPCDWSLPDFSLDLSGRLVENWNDLFSFLDETRLSWRLEAVDEDNGDGYVELGEWFLGVRSALSSAKLQPGRAEGPRLYGPANKTAYGQHWPLSFARTATLELTLWNLNDPSTVDAVRRMIEAAHENNGRLVLVPSPRHPFVYYVHIENTEGFMAQIIRGLDRELTSWTLQLETLARGIRLL